MGRLYAAAGVADLDPPVGGWLTGFGARLQPSAGLHDPITARAVLLDDGSNRLAVVSCDVVGFSPADAARMRAAIAACGVLPAAHILIATTHTHSGPASMPLRGAMGHIDAGWLAAAQARVVDLVAGLPGALRPARVGFAAPVVSGIGYNRQDGAYPIHEGLTVLALDGYDGAAIATLLNYATHPVILGPRNLHYSADYPGAARARVEQARGGVGLFLLGEAGDVDPAINRDRGWGTGTFDDVADVGRRLAAAVPDAVPLVGDVTLRAATAHVTLPLDPPPSASALAQWVRGWQDDTATARAAGDALKETIAGAMLQWAGELEQAMQAGTVPATLTAEIGAAAINDIRIVGVPFEPYSDIGLRVRAALHPLRTVFAGYTNGLHGYCASRWAKKQGGYGPETSARWFGGQLTALGLGADEALVEGCIALARSL